MRLRTDTLPSCVVWIIVFGTGSACIAPILMMASGFSSASSFAMQIIDTPLDWNRCNHWSSHRRPTGFGTDDACRYFDLKSTASQTTTRHPSDE